MGSLFTSWKLLRRPSSPSWQPSSRRPPRRGRPLGVECLDERVLLSGVLQPVVNHAPVTTPIISGPDGNLWAASFHRASRTAEIERIGLDGSVASFRVPGEANSVVQIQSLAAGADGNVWFAADFVRSDGNDHVVIGNVTPSGKVTELPPIPLAAGQSADAHSIVRGPGGDLWFGYNLLVDDNHFQDFIGRVTTSGKITLFPVSSVGPYPVSIWSLAPGADGNLWFTEGLASDNTLGRMSPNGAVTRFPVGGLQYVDVANGPNGSLIVTGENSNFQNQVMRLSTSGKLTPYTIPASISDDFYVYAGSASGSLWFASFDKKGFKLGRITPDGVATSYNLSRFVRAGNLHFVSLAVGRDGNIYMDVFAIRGRSITAATVFRFFPDKLPRVRHPAPTVSYELTNEAPVGSAPVEQVIFSVTPAGLINEKTPAPFGPLKVLPGSHGFDKNGLLVSVGNGTIPRGQPGAGQPYQLLLLTFKHGGLAPGGVIDFSLKLNTAGSAAPRLQLPSTKSGVSITQPS